MKGAKTYFYPQIVLNAVKGTFQGPLEKPRVIVDYLVINTWVLSHHKMKCGRFRILKSPLNSRTIHKNRYVMKLGMILKGAACRAQVHKITKLYPGRS